MDAMYAVEQVNIPPELGTVMKQYTKAVLRDQPKDIYKYSANFFAILCGRAAPFDEDGQLMDSAPGTATGTAAVPAPRSGKLTSTTKGDEEIQAIFSKYDTTGEGRISVEDLPRLVKELSETLGLSGSTFPKTDDIKSILPCDENSIDLLELRQLLFQS